jgi:uncharacterized membrane protein
MKNGGDFVDVILLYIAVVGTALRPLDWPQKGQAALCMSLSVVAVDMLETDN